MRDTFFRRADWIDPERTTTYSRILCFAYVVAIIVWIALSAQMIDPNGKPLGPDFMNVWAAGKLTLAHLPGDSYDYARHFAVQQQALPYPSGQEIPYFGWHYPPMFLLIAAPLALLPYGAALAVWMASTLSAYLRTMKAIIPDRRWALLALAFPGVFTNFIHGQNGFLTAGLLGGGVLLLERRPWTAGALLGLLAYKPHFGLLVPLALLADRRWRAFVAAGASAALTAGLSYLALGQKTWESFFHSLALTRTYVLEQGSTGWEKIQSTFSAVRMLGGGIELAYVAQAVVTVAALAAVAWVWRRPVPLPIKGAALATAAVMATPYVLDYDLVLLALPIAWMAAEGLRTGFRDWEKMALFAAWLLPLVSRGIGMIGVPTAPFVLAALLILIVRRAAATHRAAAPDLFAHQHLA